MAWAVVAATVGMELATLAPTLRPVAYLDDAAMHEQMVRFATSTFRSGRNPLTTWYPYLNEGSPHFLHYQGLGAMLTGLAGLVVGPDAAFRWSLYLMLALWPAVIYLSARLWRLSPLASAAAAVTSPLLMSVPSVGYEHGAYVWIGYGLWAQLWGSMGLPFAWAATYRALNDRRFLLPAGAAVALTASLHFETGYLAFGGVIVLAIFAAGPWRRRLAHGALTFALAVSMAAWSLVPLVVYGRWAAINEALRKGPLVNGYGAGRVLGWLVSGRILDNGRLPVVTVAALLGVAAAVARWRRQPALRCLLLVGVVSLLLCFGRATYGSLVDVIPGGHDVFFRRFMLGAQLAGIYLAGAGVEALVGAVRRAAGAVATRRGRASAAAPVAGLAVSVAVCALAVVPAVTQVGSYDHRNGRYIAAQRAVGSVQARRIAPLISYIRRHGGGRTYAGLPGTWADRFTVGQVQVYKYLANEDVPEVGFTLRTASLMSIPEFWFDEDDPGDYRVFGIRYLLLPAGMDPPVTARSVLQSGDYHLWLLPGGRYIQVMQTVGRLRANRANVGDRTLGLLRSGLLDRDETLTVGWDGTPGPPPTLRADRRSSTGPGGRVTAGQVALADNLASARVVLARRAVVVLSTSYDPGWHATVDGRPAPVEMIAPAVVGVVVPAGRHRVAFRYIGFPDYPPLWGVAGGGLLAGGVLGWGRRRRRPAA